MARYEIIEHMRILQKPMAIGAADTPAEAVRMAREFEKEGHKIEIGDIEAAEMYPIAAFAAKHGVR